MSRIQQIIVKIAESQSKVSSVDVSGVHTQYSSNLLYGMIHGELETFVTDYLNGRHSRERFIEQLIDLNISNLDTIVLLEEVDKVKSKNKKTHNK